MQKEINVMRIIFDEIVCEKNEKSSAATYDCRLQDGEMSFWDMLEPPSR
ncbi:hypothetical protein Pecwa_1149 [Pectobacterium parmentieri WPP163]|nr:hypothetical protein Pecwa_1149 [Pectobacterium parmentieri WPP163]